MVKQEFRAECLTVRNWDFFVDGMLVSRKLYPSSAPGSLEHRKKTLLTKCNPSASANANTDPLNYFLRKLIMSCFFGTDVVVFWRLYA